MAHILRENNKSQRVNICAPSLTRHRSDRQQYEPFLYQNVISDEKWCIYVNIKNRKVTLSERTVKHLHKLMCSAFGETNTVATEFFFYKDCVVLKP